MRHWIIMFRPETHAEAVKHGMMGVLYQYRRAFAELSVGDRFITYLSRVRRLDGHGEVLGEPADPAAAPHGWDNYVLRRGLRFDQTGADVEASKLLWGVSAITEGLRTTPANLIFCKGGFLQITPADYAWLRTVLDGTWVAPVEVPEQTS